MTTTVWILGDQLTPSASSFGGLAPDEGVVLMIESVGRARKLPYHKQKLTFIWSAMRHFAAELRERGYRVDYYELQPAFRPALEAHIKTYRPERVRLMETAAYGGSDRLAGLAEQLGLELEITPNNMFLSDRANFAAWASGKKSLQMEPFYRQMRRNTGLLMDGESPEGGRWNYDKENRETPPADHVFPELPVYEPDKITERVMKEVARRFADNFGELDRFWLPVTRQDARGFFSDFLAQRLDLFGPYEDAIVTGERVLYHSLVSSLLNVGLLDPLSVCQQAEACYYAGDARLNSVEGFIRQIIGWREFVFQVYWLRMPDYLAVNYFEASLALPDFYWTGDTDMTCVADAVETLIKYGTNHHIQRLMVTGNFALIAGLNPQAVNDWYWSAYTDAYEWVVSPNVLGMALYADGGVLASKPYAASANYINKMSDCCRHCRYNHRETNTDNACPFNSLYWDFLARNEPDLAKNPRMRLMINNLNKRNQEALQATRTHAAALRQKLRDGQKI